VEKLPVSTVDLAPTLAELAGIEPPAALDGTSLAPLIADDDPAGMSEMVFSEWIGDEKVPGWWQVRNDRFAYIELVTGERELYDLANDPYQLTNVVAESEYAGVLPHLLAAMNAFRGS
jgi:arylsulfatase A-like enzyme